jgi:hypothetical protein
LENVDPNPENYVCAGIVGTKVTQVGVLIRLEPNLSSQVSILIRISWAGIKQAHIIYPSCMAAKFKNMIFLFTSDLQVSVQKNITISDQCHCQ